MSVPGKLDDALGEIVIDLPPHLPLDIVDNLIGVGNAQVAFRYPEVAEELIVVGQDLMEAAAFTGHMVPGDPGFAFEGGGERKIGGAEDMSVIVPGGDADEGEGDLFLLAEADGGNSPLLGVPERGPKKD